ncbi:hypothetical protein GCM10023353_34640 [Tomitella cavernea]|uniref:Uncharacterized protein n=1 Tax=Tomitella cavernea TaxID=1387982 RepID=A0ABP9D145_9ACTN
MGSMPGLADLLPLLGLTGKLDSMSLNMFGSLSDSLGVTIPEE